MFDEDNENIGEKLITLGFAMPKENANFKPKNLHNKLPG